MKSIKIFAAAGAIALLGMAGLSSCKTNNGPEGPGNYNGETVKTQFSISIPEIKDDDATAAQGVKRMPAAKTQESGFLGMDNITLMPFNTAVTGSVGSKVSADVTSSDVRIGANIAGLTAITPDGGSNPLLGTSKYKVYTNISIPLGTNHFLFYAHGTTTSEPTDEQKFQEGLLSAAGLEGANLSSVSFSPVAINTNDAPETGVQLCSYLTDIANAKWTEEKEDPEPDVDHYWRDHGNAGVKQLHDDLTRMQAGSANTVLAAMEDLYNSLDSYNETQKASSGSDDNVVKAVMTAIATKVVMSGSTVGKKTAAWKTSPATSFANYPADILLPDGAAAIAWNTTDKEFKIASTYAWAAANNGSVSLDVAKITDYVYPSCIYYYANSGLKTATNTPLTTNAATINGLATWAAVLTGYYGTSSGYQDNIYVNTNTRSVVIEKPIQYGVARLKTSVKADDETILDYNSNSIDVTKLQMTAVLVGGQGPVNFEFTTSSAGTKIVYDRELTSGDYTLDDGDYTTANPTLLLETGAGKDILMAVEFLNNDKDFYGVDGKLIPKGTKFYVVAQLLASAATETTTHVFKQDYTTTVKLNLKTLAKAYNVIPDLRAAALELGFSVDLTWQNGHEYEINIQ